MPAYAYADKARSLLQHIPSSSSHQVQLPSNQLSLVPLPPASDPLLPPTNTSLLDFVSVLKSLSENFFLRSSTFKGLKLLSVLCSMLQF